MRTWVEKATAVLFPVACVLVIGVAGFQIYDRVANQRGAQPRSPVQPVSGLSIQIGQAAVTKQGAPAFALVEFSDFECPYCGKYARETYPQLRREFVDTGQIAYVFVHAPIESIHRNAVGAAALAQCAGRRGKFWEMHDLLFQNQKDLAAPGLDRLVTQLGLETADLPACMTGAIGEVREQMAIAAATGAKSTPVFFLGRLDGAVVTAVSRISGAVPFDTFATAIRAATSGQTR